MTRGVWCGVRVLKQVPTLNLDFVSPTVLSVRIIWRLWLLLCMIPKVPMDMDLIANAVTMSA